ncbi:glycosyltransferase, partial [Escherichia coli]|nr:glycosyltransferase [Escherichia coli]
MGVDETIFRPPIESKQPNSAKLKILYAGRLELAKGVQYLLEAFRSMRGKNVELHLVGSVLPEFRPLLRKFADERVKVH